MTIALILITIALGCYLLRQWWSGELAAPEPRRQPAPLPLASRAQPAPPRQPRRRTAA